MISMVGHLSGFKHTRMVYSPTTTELTVNLLDVIIPLAKLKELCENRVLVEIVLLDRSNHGTNFKGRYTAREMHFREFAETFLSSQLIYYKMKYDVGTMERAVVEEELQRRRKTKP